MSDNKKNVLRVQLWMISYSIYFYLSLSQVFLEAASNALWNEDENEFLKRHYLASPSERCFKMVKKDIIPICQMSERSQGGVSICPTLSRDTQCTLSSSFPDS